VTANNLAQWHKAVSILLAEGTFESRLRTSGVKRRAGDGKLPWNSVSGSSSLVQEGLLVGVSSLCLEPSSLASITRADGHTSLQKLPARPSPSLLTDP
jgi:hypothetical protein